MGWQEQALWKRYLEHARKRMAEAGWFLQGHEAGIGRPPRIYTVGLTEAGLPELYMQLDPEATSVQPYERAIAAAVQFHLRGFLEPGCAFTSESAPYRIVAMAAAQTRINLTVARDLFGRDRLKPAYQLVPGSP